MSYDKKNPLRVQGLCKTYPSFRLEDVSFSLAPGMITGFIGRNGAGKTTTINSVLSLVHPDSGEITFFGMPFAEHDREIKEKIGFVSAGMTYYTRKKLQVITGVAKTFYPAWDDGVYRSYMAEFGLDGEKTPAELSNGMKIKYALALAARRPDVYVIAADMLLGRVRKVQKRVLRDHLSNLHVLKSESRVLISRTIPDAFVDRVNLLCPDPWPKDKHEIKRLVCSDFLCRLRRVLKPGGILHMSTDHAPYFDAWLRFVGQLSWFERADGASDDVADIKTDFEELWLSQGKTVQHVNWRLVG